MLGLAESFVEFHSGKTQRMDSYAIRIEGEEPLHAPFTGQEVSEALRYYQEEHPEDEQLRRVSVYEMHEGGTVGLERSVWNFVGRQAIVRE